MRFSLIEAYVHLHLEHWYIGGCGEVDRLGRRWRQDAEFTSQARFLGWFRTHVARMELCAAALGLGSSMFDLASAIDHALGGWALIFGIRSMDVSRCADGLQLKTVMETTLML